MRNKHSKGTTTTIKKVLMTTTYTKLIGTNFGPAIYRGSRTNANKSQREQRAREKNASAHIHTYNIYPLRNGTRGAYNASIATPAHSIAHVSQLLGKY